MRTSTVGALLATACLLAACTPPASAAVTQCQGGISERSCTVKVERFEQPASTTFRSSSSNLGLDVQGSFTVRSGSATVAIRGAEGVVSEVTVTPEQPAEITANTRLQRGNRSRDEDPFFTLQLRPNGVVEGLSGTVHYQARSQSQR